MDMDIIVDASVIIAVIADEPEKSDIVSLTQGAHLVAPRSVHWEIGNVFSAMLKRQRVTLEQAIEALQVYKTIPIRFVEVDLELALEIAARLRIYAYDAYLIQCASKYKIPLMTLDQDLADYAIQEGVRIVKVN
jgi:predicted nucleic acid-binding protein